MTTHYAPAPSRRVQPPPPAPQRKRSLWWLWLMLLLLVLGALSFVGFRLVVQRLEAARAAANQAPRAVPVVGAPATRGDFPIYLEADGTVTALNTVTVRTRVDGQIVSVAYREGQEVNAGDLLAEIDPRPFQVQLAQAQGQLAKDQAVLENAKRDLARYQAAADAIPQQLIDTAASTVAQTEGAVKTDEGQIASANLQITYCKITAPISGRAGLRLVDIGNIVHASDTSGIVVLTQDHPISLVFSLGQSDLAAVLHAMQITPDVPVEAYDSNIKTRLAAGKLLAVDNQIDVTTNTFRLKATFENQDNALFPNQFVNVRLLVDTRKDAVLVPSGAVQTSPTTSFVYVIKSDDTVEMRPISVGPKNENVTVVDRGLNAGEMVVTDGLDRLQQGTKVSVRSDSNDVEPKTRRAAGTDGGSAAAPGGTRTGRGAGGSSRGGAGGNGGGTPQP